MLVDHAVLRAFASQTDVAATVIAANDPSPILVESCAGLQGSSAEWAANLLRGHVEMVTQDLTRVYSGMATTARGNADSYEVTEQNFTEGLGKIAGDS